MRRAIVAGAIASKYLNGGEPWIRLSWVIGLHRLGYEVLFIEQLPTPERCPVACLDWYRRIVTRFGMDGAAALVAGEGESVDGVSFGAALEFARTADLLINISGHLTIESLRDRPRRKVFIDEDPGFTQFWYDDGLARAQVDGHDAHYTLGRNIGQGDCVIPACGIDWRPLYTPVVLSDWPAAGDAAPLESIRFTTIGAWRGSFGVVQRGGTTYGLKAHEFRKFIELPKHFGTRGTFEAALHLHPADARDLSSLEANAWRVINPQTVTPDPWTFRAYVQRSSAEFSVAKGVYAGTNSGWFSDRTTRYLASGRPALVQETGFSRELPTGVGLVAFSTLDEAVEGAESIRRNYRQHSRAARSIAERYFDSDKVIAGMLRELDLADRPVHV